MLTLSPGSSCDVCAEEYGPHCMPHCIPCGHVLCASCCNTIVAKTSPRLTPVCPFCREEFSLDSIRLIRIDFSSLNLHSTNAWSNNTPRRRIVVENDDFALNPDDLAMKKEERIVYLDNETSRTRAGARVLEDKVARVAAKKCSVEEVTKLHKELQEWLVSEVDHKTSSLYLSAALLRAILMNHVAHSEATKLAKITEANYKAKVDDLEIIVTKLEAELKKQRTEYSQKAQECQNLTNELHRFKVKSGIGTPATPRPIPISTASSQAAAAAAAAASTSPTPAPSTTTSASTTTTATTPIYAPTARTPLSRFASTHARSASVQPSSISRTFTPVTTTARSETPHSTHHVHHSHSHHQQHGSNGGSHHNPHAHLHTPRPSRSGPRKQATDSPPPPMPPLPPMLLNRTTSNSSSASEDSDHGFHERWIPSAASRRDTSEPISPTSYYARSPRRA